MLKKKIYSIIIICLYAGACLFSLCYEKTAKSVFGYFINSPEDAPEINVRFSEISDWHKESFPYRQNFLDIYGLTMRCFDKRVIGDFVFLQDVSSKRIEIVDSHTEDPECYVNTFAQSLDVIKQNISGDTLLYVAYPKRNSIFDYTDSSEVHISGDASRIVLDNLLLTDVDCIDMDTLFSENQFGQTRDTVRFKTDGHFTTEAELWIANTIADWLMEEGYSLFDYENIFDFSNYEVTSYDFLGNSGRNVGKYYVGKDVFNIYKPQFNTNITVTVPNQQYTATGTFEQVVLNGYENNPYDIYTYWVTDYGHFGSPCYYYDNNLAPDTAPKVLFICDSAAMRTFSYLSLACKKVTVLDPRIFNAMPYVEYELGTETYDAVVVLGTDTLMYESLSLKPIQKMISEESYGDWTGRSGICLDYVNNTLVDNSGSIYADITGENVNIFGWAANFNADMPFSELYCRAGGIIFKCEYGIDRQSVVDYYHKEALRYTGFHVTIPTNVILSGNRTIEFIGKTEDGTYGPVLYSIQ